MKSKFFPSLSEADTDGFLAWSPDLLPEYVIDAYQNAIFPWPQKESEILWFSPPERGIIEFDDLHLSRSFKKWLRQDSGYLDIKIDSDFDELIEACRDQNRPDQEGTWITNDILDAYKLLFEQGHVHCLSVYRGSKLVAGIYGVYVGGYFSAESMFFREPNSSKFAFYKLINFLKSQGHKWMDIQMLTPVSEAFGGTYISRDHFVEKIEDARVKKIPWAE